MIRVWVCDWVVVGHGARLPATPWEWVSQEFHLPWCAPGMLEQSVRISSSWCAARCPGRAESWHVLYVTADHRWRVWGVGCRSRASNPGAERGARAAYPWVALRHLTAVVG